MALSAEQIRGHDFVGSTVVITGRGGKLRGTIERPYCWKTNRKLSPSRANGEELYCSVVIKSGKRIKSWINRKSIIAIHHIAGSECPQWLRYEHLGGVK